MKRPSFQFYPADWLRDTALRSCSTGARGLWIDMICWMHEGSPYGHLKVGNKVILPPNLARMVGETLDVVEGWLQELRSANVFEQHEDGTIVSRRMIRDEYLRNTRAAGGKLGGNPMLKVNLPPNLEDNQEVDEKDKQIPTPSSSSSSSSSSSKKIQIQRPEDVTEDTWQTFIAARKLAKAVVSDRVLESIRKEAAKAEMSLDAALCEMCARGWRGFKAKWVIEKASAIDERRNQMSELTRGLSVHKPKGFWSNAEIIEAQNVEAKRLL